MLTIIFELTLLVFLKNQFTIMMAGFLAAPVITFVSTVWLFAKPYGNNRLYAISEQLNSGFIEAREGGMFEILAGGFSLAAFALMGLFFVGHLYWLWMAFKIGSFGMFLFGMVPPALVVAGVVGAYALIYEMPSWVYSWFGWWS